MGPRATGRDRPRGNRHVAVMKLVKARLMAGDTSTVLLTPCDGFTQPGIRSLARTSSGRLPEGSKMARAPTPGAPGAANGEIAGETRGSRKTPHSGNDRCPRSARSTFGHELTPAQHVTRQKLVWDLNELAERAVRASDWESEFEFKMAFLHGVPPETTLDAVASTLADFEPPRRNRQAPPPNMIAIARRAS